MPSQEDYLDKLLMNMGKTEKSESEELASDELGFDTESEELASDELGFDTESEEPASDELGFDTESEEPASDELKFDSESREIESDAAEFDILEDTESEFTSENVEDLLEDAVSDLEEALGFEGDLDLNDLLEQETNAVLGADELTDPMDIEAAAVLEELLPEADLPETDALLEDAVADLETVLENDWEEADIETQDYLEEAEEAIQDVQEEEDVTEQVAIEPFDTLEALETMEVPDATEESVPVEIPETVDEPEPADMPDTMDVAEALELLDVMEEPEAVEISETAPDLEAVSTMSEEEIEQFLSASAAEDQLQISAGDEAAEGFPDEDIDLMGLLGDTEDNDLLDIHDMLDKADNNEAVSEEIEALLQGAEMPDATMEEGITEIDDKKRKRTQDKKLKRQEKAAARKAAKEAKATAKAAAKEGKVAPIPSEHTENADIADNTDNTDTLFDSDLLDSIVTGAEQAGLETMGQSEESVESTGQSDNGSADGLEFDMDSLFGNGDDSGLGSDLETLPDDAFPDFIGLKKEDADIPLPEMENEGKKKKGLLARFFDMLTEEDEDEESESIQLSDENKEILNDLDKEKTSGKKKKKKKVAPGQGDEEDGEGGKGKKAKKPKKPKPEKPKKVKEPDPEPLIPEKKLTPKKVIPVLLVCASLGILLIVFTNASVDYTDKKTAHDAYYEGDYQTCYENLFGKELNETEQIMFGTSESILRMRLWLREYEMFVEADEEVEALDSLIQTVNDYPELYAYAVQFNAGDAVMTAYANILNILYEKYGLTEAQAQEIAAVRSNYTYTQMVVDIVLGKPFGSWNEPENTESEPEASPLPDELPEEGELSGGSFINNQ